MKELDVKFYCVLPEEEHCPRGGVCIIGAATPYELCIWLRVSGVYKEEQQ